jgi:hypothetical protein
MADKKIIHAVNKITSNTTPKVKGVNYRVNKMGDVEQVKKKPKDNKEETLNELSEDILKMLEDIEYGSSSPAGSAVMADEPTWSRMTNQRRPPSYTGASGDSIRNAGDTISNMSVSNRPAANIDVSKIRSKSPASPRGRNRDSKVIDTSFGDSLDYGATHSESFSGTGGIAMMPTAFGVGTKSARNKSKKKGRLAGFDSLQELFNGYVSCNNVVDVKDFQVFCESNGLDIIISRDLLLYLMERNDSYVFHEGLCNRGPFWFTESFLK